MKRPFFTFILCALLLGLVSSCVTMEELLKNQDEEPAGYDRMSDAPVLQPVIPDEEPGLQYDEYGRPVARTPQESLDLVMRGKQLLAQGDSLGAVEDFTNAIAIDSGMADAYYYRGLAYDMGGDYERAVEDFTMTADINPEYMKAYFSRAEVYVKLGNISNAIDDFSRACTMGYTAGCAERERLIGSNEGSVFDEGNMLP